MKITTVLEDAKPLLWNQRICSTHLNSLSVNLRFHQQGVYVPEIDLWFDPSQPTKAAWISHGHSDHACGVHQNAYATPETLEIYRLRLPPDRENEPSYHPVPYGRPWRYNGATLTAYPAAHVVGAAQLLVEYAGQRLVYTGDIKLRDPICGRPTQIVPCDHLVVESTFGLPIYHFLSAEDAKNRIVDFAKETLAAKQIPAFIGYALGRGQEIAHVLCRAGIPTAVHGAIAKFIPLYERAGYAFPGWEPYLNHRTAGKAVVVVPTLRNALEATGKGYRFAYVSGWASLSNARARANAEELIPYSDHADFGELLEFVDRTGARRVDVVHGYTDLFAAVLRARGIDARAPLPAAARADGETDA